MSDRYKLQSSSALLESSPNEQHVGHHEHHHVNDHEIHSTSTDETGSIQHLKFTSSNNEESELAEKHSFRNIATMEETLVSNVGNQKEHDRHHKEQHDSNMLIIPPRRNQIAPLNLGALSNAKSRPNLVSVRTQKTLNTDFLIKQNSSTLNSLRSSKEIRLSMTHKEKSTTSLNYSKQTEENDRKGEDLSSLEEGKQKLDMSSDSRSSIERNLMGVSTSISSNISYSVVSKEHEKRRNFSKLLAKIPLSVKLFLIFIFSLACMVVFEGILINFSVMVSFQQFQTFLQFFIKRVRESKSNTLLTIFTTGISDIIHELQKERGSSSLYLGSKGTLFITELSAQRVATDFQLSKWNTTKQGIIDFFSLSDEIIAKKKVEPTLASIDQTFQLIAAHRYNISTLQFPVAKVALDFYTNVIKNMIDIVNVATSLGIDPNFLIKSNIYSLMMVMKESLGLKRATVSNAIAAGAFTSDFYVSYLYLRSRFDVMYTIIDSKSRNNECYEYFEQLSLSVNNATVTNMMESYLLASPYNLTYAKTLFTAQNWFWNITIKIDELKTIENMIRDDILTVQNASEQGATNELIGYTVGGIMGIFLSSILSFIFSRTIQDLLRLHNETVHKFVPKEFMKIVQKENVTDLNHGDYFEMELDVMFADIRGYTSICEKMTPDETFEFLNNYLSLVGPVVREHGGYIDKYLGDGILALFLTPGQSVLAAMELQRRLLEFNKSKKYPTVRVGIGIARGKCAVGLIGEDQRVDPTIIGDTVNLSARLESLTKHYRVDILVTKEVIETSPIIPSNNQRRIGRLAVVGRQQACWVFEIMSKTPSTVLNNSHNLKAKTKSQFEDAIEIMYGTCTNGFCEQDKAAIEVRKHKFGVGDSLNMSSTVNNIKSDDILKAIEILRKIVNRDPNDFVASMRLEKLEEMVTDVSIRSSWAFEDRLDTK